MPPPSTRWQNTRMPEDRVRSQRGLRGRPAFEDAHVSHSEPSSAVIRKRTLPVWGRPV